MEAKKEFVANTLPKLLCLTCKNPPRPDGPGKERHFCIKCGASICAQCFLGLPIKRCTFLFRPRQACLGKLAENPSKVMTEIFKDLPFACINYSRGCREIMDKEQLLDHENQECEFADPMICCFNCSKKIPRNEYHQHCLVDHDFKEIEEGEFFWIKFEDSSTFEKPFLLSTLDTHFFVVFRKEGKFCVFWIYNPWFEDPSRFAWSITIENENGEKGKTFRGFVKSMRETPKEISIKKTGCYLSLDELKQFNGKDEKVFLDLSIYNLKEEPKDIEVLEVF